MLELVDHYVNSSGSKADYPISWIPLSGWQIGIMVVIFIVIVIVTRGRIVIHTPYSSWPYSAEVEEGDGAVAELVGEE